MGVGTSLHPAPTSVLSSAFWVMPIGEGRAGELASGSGWALAVSCCTATAGFISLPLRSRP